MSYDPENWGGISPAMLRSAFGCPTPTPMAPFAGESQSIVTLDCGVEFIDKIRHVLPPSVTVLGCDVIDIARWRFTLLVPDWPYERNEALLIASVSTLEVSYTLVCAKPQ